MLNFTMFWTTIFSRSLRWMKKGQRETWDVEWQPEFSHQTNFNIQPSPSLPPINFLMEAESEGNIIGGKLPRSLWPEAGWGLQCMCVCVSRGGRGRRQHPGRTFGTLFPAALATLLLRLHKSLPAGSMLLLPGDSHFFPRPCPASSDSLSLPNDPGFGHCFPYLSFPRAVVLYPCPLSLSVTHCVVWCALLAASTGST